jgi:hypothetical protein
MGEGPAREPPKRAVLPSIANGARLLTGRSRKAVDGPFTTHNTTECRRFNKDGSQKVSVSKSFDSAKKPWKKPGSGNADQISHLTEKMTKLKKRLKKSKKHSKKRARDSSDSDSDSS